MFSLFRLALAHWEKDETAGDVAVKGSVGASVTCWKGVLVGMVAAEGVSVLGTSSVFCAATVCATDVWMTVCVSSVGVPAPQEVRIRVVIIEILKSKYFIDRVIFFLSFAGNYYTVK